jgi:hypothetical protein
MSEAEPAHVERFADIEKCPVDKTSGAEAVRSRVSGQTRLPLPLRAQASVPGGPSDVAKEPRSETAPAPGD